MQRRGLGLFPALAIALMEREAAFIPGRIRLRDPIPTRARRGQTGQAKVKRAAGKRRNQRKAKRASRG